MIRSFDPPMEVTDRWRLTDPQVENHISSHLDMCQVQSKIKTEHTCILPVCPEAGIKNPSLDFLSQRGLPDHALMIDSGQKISR